MNNCYRSTMIALKYIKRMLFHSMFYRVCRVRSCVRMRSPKVAFVSRYRKTANTQFFAHFYRQLNILNHRFACGINFIEDVGQHTHKLRFMLLFHVGVSCRNALLNCCCCFLSYCCWCSQCGCHLCAFHSHKH